MILEPIQEYIQSNKLPMNGLSLNGSIHAGFTAVIYSKDRNSAKELCYAQAELYDLLRQDIAEASTERFDVESMGIGVFNKEVFVDSALKIYDFIWSLVLLDDSSIFATKIKELIEERGDDNAS